MKPQIWQTLLCCFAAAMFLTLGVLAADIVDSGTCGADGDNLTWTLDSDGVLTISGTGEMEDYFWMMIPWEGRRRDITSVIINKGVTVLCDDAFYYCPILTSVTIPESVTTIGSNFIGCGKLEKINIASSNPEYSSIDGVLFDKNQSTLIFYPRGKSDTTYTIPDSVVTIDNAAFANCENLTSINIPSSVTTINFAAFAGCQITNITIPDSVITTGDRVFMECNSLTSITIPDSVTAIGEQAFYHCEALTDVIIGNGITIISREAFCGCDKLISVTIGHNVTTISTYAFNSCDSLTDVTIPSNVTFIGLAAFGYCDSLKNVIIGNGATAIGSHAFAGCVNLTKVKIGDGATTIRSYAFLDCQNLKDATIPKSVTRIESGAFNGCLNVVLCVYENSYAHTYAVENGLAYEFISDEVGTVRAGAAKTILVTAETCDVTLDCSGANISAGAAYRILYALCDEHGQLLSVGSADVTFDASASADFTVEGIQAGLTCRIFLLNDKASPQCAATQLTFVG